MAITSLGECYNANGNSNLIWDKISPMISKATNVADAILKKEEYVNEKTVTVNGKAILTNNIDGLWEGFFDNAKKMNDAFKSLKAKMWKYRYDQITNELIPYLEKKKSGINSEYNAKLAAAVNQTIKQSILQNKESEISYIETQLKAAKEAQQEASSQMKV